MHTGLAAVPPPRSLGLTQIAFIYLLWLRLATALSHSEEVFLFLQHVIYEPLHSKERYLLPLRVEASSHAVLQVM